MHPESGQSRASLPLVISLAKLYLYELEYPSVPQNPYRTPEDFQPLPQTKTSLDSPIFLREHKSNLSLHLDNQWIQTSIRIPYSPNDLMAILTEWEQGNDVYLEFPFNHTNTIHKALINGVLKQDEITESGIDKFLRLRFYINPSFFTPNTYIFPC